jgi:Cdc6-like AAA superfamily ATPase
MPSPRDNEGWRALRSEVNEAFTPGSPIRSRSDLAGRGGEIERLTDIIQRAGEHALIYGEMGVGKTSLARTFHAGLNRGPRRVQEIHVNCIVGDDFSSIWRKVFRRMAVEVDGQQLTVDRQYPNLITPDDVEIELSNYSLNDVPIVILDEFDKVADKQARALIANTVKSMGDRAVHTKVILVGVADDAGELIENHASLTRNLKQVKMPRLSLGELEEIIAPRLKRCGVSISEDALFQIAFLSRGLPYYSHLIGRNAALFAIEAKRVNVTEDDVLSGLTLAMQDVDQTITEDYLKAIRSQRNEETLFESVLIACSLADADDLGRFQQAAVAAPLSHIEARTPPYTAATFAFHMNEFCEAKRGNILLRSGEIRNYRYRFRDPMMQPYVVIRALQNGKLKRDTFNQFVTRRQGSLPIGP